MLCYCYSLQVVGQFKTSNLYAGYLLPELITDIFFICIAEFYTVIALFYSELRNQTTPIFTNKCIVGCSNLWCMSGFWEVRRRRNRVINLYRLMKG